MYIPALMSGQLRYLLVVDHDRNDRFTMSMLLQRFGYTVASASGAAEGIEFLCVAPAEAVFVEAGDVAAELTGRLRTDARFRDVPVVLVSAGYDRALEERCRRGEFAGLLRLPLDPEQVFQVLQKVIEKGSRSNIRIPTALPAAINGDFSSTEGYVTVLSEFGMFFRTLNPRPARERVSVDLSLWDRRVSVEAEVLYLVSFDEGPFCEPGMGMKFTKIAPEDRALIRAYIYEQISLEIAPPGGEPAAGTA